MEKINQIFKGIRLTLKMKEVFVSGTIPLRELIKNANYDVVYIDSTSLEKSEFQDFHFSNPYARKCTLVLARATFLFNEMVEWARTNNLGLVYGRELITGEDFFPVNNDKENIYASGSIDSNGNFLVVSEFHTTDRDIRTLSLVSKDVVDQHPDNWIAFKVNPCRFCTRHDAWCQSHEESFECDMNTGKIDCLHTRRFNTGTSFIFEGGPRKKLYRCAESDCQKFFWI